MLAYHCWQSRKCCLGLRDALKCIEMHLRFCRFGQDLQRERHYRKCRGCKQEVGATWCTHAYADWRCAASSITSCLATCSALQLGNELSLASPPVKARKGLSRLSLHDGGKSRLYH